MRRFLGLLGLGTLAWIGSGCAGAPAAKATAPAPAATERDALAAGGAAGIGASVGVRRQRFGFLEVGIDSVPALPDALGGVGATCGVQGGTGYRPASWQSLSVAEDGAIRVEGAEAWFDYHAC